jgi:hypothetical protein
MKKLLLLIIYNVSLIALCSAQNPLVKQWDKRFGGTSYDWLSCFQQTNDGGYILGGYSNSGISGDKTQDTIGSFDYWIAKTDSIGIKQWDKDFGGNNGENLISLQQTTDGGYILGGISNSGISGDKTQDTIGSFDYWIVKTDSFGNKQWDKRFGGTSYDWLSCFQQTTDGGYILGGYSNSGISGDKTQDTIGGDDFWIVKIDSLGAKQWDRDFGGTNQDYFSSLQQTADGGYILGGTSASDSSGNKTQDLKGGFFDYWIIKTDSIGMIQWDKDLGGEGDDWLRNLLQTTDGGYILGGISDSDSSGDKSQNARGGNFDSDYWIIKIDSFGNKQWDKEFGGINSEDEFNSILQTTDGGYLLSGTSYSNIGGDKTENNLSHEQSWIIKTDSLGNKNWDKTLQTNYGTLGDDEIGLAVQTKDGCFAMVNYTYAGIGGDKTQSNQDPNCTPFLCSTDYWIIKFCDTTSTTSINLIPNYQNTFSISPNPARESVVISSEYGEKNKTPLILFDVFGNELYRDILRTPNYRLPVSSLTPGIYFLKAGNEVRKFIKE